MGSLCCSCNAGGRISTVAEQVWRQGDGGWAYFKDHRYHMGCPRFLAKGLPIGSGATEAACKPLVQQQSCASGMHRKTKSANIVLIMRALTQTAGRWTQFWQKIDQCGPSTAAD